jgi:hypothetical protein
MSLVWCGSLSFNDDEDDGVSRWALLAAPLLPLPPRHKAWMNDTRDDTTDVGEATMSGTAAAGALIWYGF